MKPVLPVLLKDAYKIGHKFQYPKDTTLIYSNLTPRSSRIEGDDKVVAFGFQYLILEYFIRQFEENFFKQDRDKVVAQYKRRVDNMLGPGTDVSHIGELHEMRYLPLHVKAVPEGTLIPLRVPLFTIRNTEPRFFWLTNMLETLISNILWLPITSATTAFHYRKVFQKYGMLTGGDLNFIPWQGHDFSMRGMAGIEAACLSGAAHLLSFTGTDTIPAIDFLENYYGANSDVELVGGSVPATEHSVMCVGLEDGEFETFKRLITEVYPTGIVSIVSDTWDFWKVITEFLPRLKDTILAREGKVVIRPDSGDPVKIICGDPATTTWYEQDGAIECLWKIFGGTMTGVDVDRWDGKTQFKKSYRVLDPHIGLIYGDSITRERQQEICAGLERNRFASTNDVLGIGSFTYQYATRDTYGMAMKATYAETLRGSQAIFKAPKTDNGVKNSAKGLLRVEENPVRLVENCSWDEEAGGLLQTIFKNGVHYNFQTLSQIRKRIEDQL